MRNLEWLLLFVDLFLLACCLFQGGIPGWARPAAVIPLVVVALHLGVEGYRWQMALGYLAALVLFLAFGMPRFLKLGWLTGGGVGLCLLAAAAMGTLLPVFEFPRPTGPFTIGSVRRHLTDPARAETHGPDGESRELMAQIWYPADRPGIRQYYRADVPATLRNEHLRLVPLHSFSGAPVARSLPPYPVLVFSPAWTGNCNQLTCLAEELASQGFVVVGLDHPYGSDPTVFPDGRVVPTALGRWMDYSSNEAMAASERAAEAELHVRTADVRFTLDELERLDRDDPDGLLTGRVDTSRVGVFGFSFGGAVAAEVCRTDPRVRAGVNLDGILFGGPKTRSIGKPFLYFSDDTPVPTPGQLEAATGPARRGMAFLAEADCRIRRRLAECGGYYLTLRGASHMNFCDSPLYTPVRRWTDAGPIRPRRAMEIINAYVAAFFRATLDGRDEPLLGAVPSPYPEVVMDRFVTEKG
jgi:predicted dienelactone hydrolase